MELNFKKMAEKYYATALNTLTKNIKIDSVYDATTVSKEAPYGKGVKKCFDFIKQLAISDGFLVDMCDGRCIEISTGAGARLVGVFGHQDVVPISGSWKYPPFSAEIEDNIMYGRGTSDDKGPIISAYYALKLLKDHDLINNYRVKLVMGGDEERGSSCLEYYFKTLKKEQPTYGFTPDGDFPLIYGEKGIMNYKYEGSIHFPDIISIEAGVVANSVIDKAKVVVKDPLKLDIYLKNHPEIEYKKINENSFVFYGQAAHGSTPEKGVNAGVIVLESIGKAYDISFFKIISEEYKDYNGRNLEQFYESENLGKTTYNVGLISYDGIKFSMTINFRYPETVNGEKVIEEIQRISPLPIYILSKSEYLYFDPENTPFIKALYDVYVEETGDRVNKPLTIGGGTYAKEVENTVAFGSCFPSRNDHIHEANEKIHLEDFYNSIAIYAHAIYKLGTLEDESNL